MPKWCVSTLERFVAARDEHILKLNQALLKAKHERKWAVGRLEKMRRADLKLMEKCGVALSQGVGGQKDVAKPPPKGSQPSSARLAPRDAPVAKGLVRKADACDEATASKKGKARAALKAMICKDFKNPAKKPKALCPRCWYFALDKRGGPSHDAVRFTCYGNQKGSGE